MSATRILGTVVRCDHIADDGHPCTSHLLVGYHDCRSAARTFAAERGWAVIDGHDRCPKHRTAP